MAKAVPYRKWFTTGTQNTRFRNAQMLRQFCECIGKTPEQLRPEYVEARKSVDSLDDWKRETRNHNWNSNQLARRRLVERF